MGPVKLKKTYSSVLRHATKRAKGLPDINEEGDTDSVASDASSIRRPMKQQRAPPLQRRRSTRIMEYQSGLQSQNTVVMKPSMQRGQTKWAKHRITDTAKLKQQDTLLTPRDSSIPLPPSSSKRRHNGPAGNHLMKKQSTTAALRGLMDGACLEDTAPDTAPVVTANDFQNAPAPRGRTKRRIGFVESATDPPAKRLARPGILKRRTATSASGARSSAVETGVKHALSDTDEETDAGEEGSGRQRKRARPLMRKQSTVAAHQGQVFVPGKEEWPVSIDGQVVWMVPLMRGDGSRKHALAVHVEPSRCLLGDEDGTVVALDEQVRPVCEYHLPAGVKCLLPDAQHVYAGCNDGALYDISHQEPRLIWQAKGFGQLYQLDSYQGQVAVSDEHGNVGLVSYDGAFLWTQRSSGAFGWMVKVDDAGVYHGHAGGITKYSRLDGQQLWHCATQAPVMAGCKVEDFLYAAVGATVIRVDKYTGDIVQKYEQGKASSGVLHCCAVGGGLVYAGGNKLLCYDAASGAVVYVVKLAQRAESLHYFQARLFCLGAGALHVLDFTHQSIVLAQHGKSVVTVEVSPDPSAPRYTPLKQAVTMTSQQSEQELADGAVLIECYKEKPKARQGKLKVRALSSGYRGKLAIQFPSDLCKPGARYVVDKLELAEGSQFYRVSGKIQEIQAKETEEKQ